MMHTCDDSLAEATVNIHVSRWLLKPENEALPLQAKCAALVQRATCPACHTLTCKALARNALTRKMKT